MYYLIYSALPNYFHSALPSSPREGNIDKQSFKKAIYVKISIKVFIRDLTELT
jgi:hypothetical protein